jgi:AraC-like DNA-binding protein
MQQPLALIFLSSAIICLLLASGFLGSKKLQFLPARLHGINYLLCALQNFLGFILFGYGWEWAGLVRATTAMTLGPAIYFYYSSLLENQTTFNRHWLLHLIPAGLVLLLWLSKSSLLWLVDYLIIGSFAIYLATSVKLLLGGSQRLQHLAQYAEPAYRWLMILVAIMGINLIVEMLVSVELATGVAPRESWAILLGAGTFLIFHSATMLLVLTRAPIMEWIHSLPELRFNKTPTMRDAEAQDIFERWERTVQERELYKRECGLTLDQAGRILAIPARHISQSINRIYGGSFSQYLNDCRVKAAQTILKNNPDISITDLMLEAGFNTKSNFNKEFLRVTGLSPSEYKKQIFSE